MGHLFVLHGNIIDLACDAVLVPCDEHRHVVIKHWGQFIPKEQRQPGPVSKWVRVTGDSLPEHDNRVVRLVQGTAPDGDPDTIGRAAADAVRAVAASLQAHDGRERPLVAVPLLGSGDGGFRHRRGAVVKSLLPHLRAAAEEVDVALVVRDPRDYQAVQSQRLDDHWAELAVLRESETLLQAADRLGHLAGAQSLSLFLGAGVSLPAGAPLWQDLLNALRKHVADPSLVPRTDDPIHDATLIEQNIKREDFEKTLTDLLGDLSVAPAHALLASLDAAQAVTTNYDRAFEKALEGAGKSGRFKVLARELPAPPTPYLLKVHGDIAKPSTIVLTEAGYEALNQELRALTSVIDSLLHTGHLLFVGYGLKDKTFVDSAQRVEAVRRLADVPSDAPFATVLALKASDVHASPGLDVIAMASDEASDREAGRMLEIFLDRLAWSASRKRGWSGWMLHDAYDDLLQPPDRKLLAALQPLRHAVSPESPAAGPLSELFVRLGETDAN